MRNGKVGNKSIPGVFFGDGYLDSARPRIKLTVTLIVIFYLCAIAMSKNDTRASETPTLPLHAAAARNDVASVRNLLDRGAAIDGRDSRGRTALLVATHRNAVEESKGSVSIEISKITNQSTLTSLNTFERPRQPVTT